MNRAVQALRKPVLVIVRTSGRWLFCKAHAIMKNIGQKALQQKLPIGSNIISISGPAEVQWGVGISGPLHRTIEEKLNK